MEQDDGERLGPQVAPYANEEPTARHFDVAVLDQLRVSTG
jgi:hypothetical protein